MSEIPKINESVSRIGLALTLLQSKMNECNALYKDAIHDEDRLRLLAMGNECNEHVAIAINEMADYIVQNSNLVCQEMERLKKEALNG